MSPRIVADFSCFWGWRVFKESKLMLLLARPSFSTKELKGSFMTFTLARCAILFDRSSTLSRSRCCNNSKLKWHFSKYLATSSMMHRYICRLFSTLKSKNKTMNKVISSSSDCLRYLLPVSTATEVSRSLFAEQHFPLHFRVHIATSCKARKSFLVGFLLAVFGFPQSRFDIPEKNKTWLLITRKNLIYN